MNNIQLIIPMSGIGRRFLSEGYSLPKPLIEVDDYPMIKHVIDLFPGVTDVIFICNENHIKNTDIVTILKKYSPSCKILSVPNENRKGPVDAIFKSFNEIDDNKQIIVSYCDYGTKWDFKEFIKDINDRNLSGSIACYTGFHPHMLGSDNYAFVNEKNKIAIEVKEKEPFTNNRMLEYASNGTYFFKDGKILKKYFKQLIDNEMSVNGEYYVSLVYNLMIKDGLKVGVFEIEKMLQWGTPGDLRVYKSWSDYFKNSSGWEPKVNCPVNTTLILPMSGKGSRFSEIGYKLPKPLIPVNDNLMVIESVKCLPITKNKVFICLSEHVNNYNIDTILKNNYENCNVVTIDSVTNGQACTCEIGIKSSNIDLESPILISACDNGIYYNNSELENLINDINNDIIVWTFRNNETSKLNPNSYAWLDVDQDNNIRHVSCKKFIYDDPLKTHAIIGTMFFRKAKFFIEGLTKNYEENITTNNEFYVDDVINQNIKNGLVVKVFEVDNYICWGTPNDLKTYNYWKDFFIK